MTERLAIPNLGNYTVALAAMVTGMGAEPWWSTYTNDHAMALGIAAGTLIVGAFLFGAVWYWVLGA
jgi:hypothetical protein